MRTVPEEMAAAVLQEPGRVAVERRPVPAPAPGQVLVEVDHCGICGSDVHLLFEGWGKPGLVAGHEVTGTVVGVGDPVGRWSPGDQVVVGPSPRCGECRRCLEGQPSQCERRRPEAVDSSDGAFAEFMLVSEAALLALPPGLSPRVAALAEPLAVALHGITRAHLSAEDTVMIFGAGPIGALSLAALVADGREGIVVVEPSPERAELARSLGAAEVISPDDLERFDRFGPQQIASRAVHAVLECSGKRQAMEAGIEQLRRGGILCMVGAGIDHPTFDPNRLILNELTITGCFIYDEHGFQHALDLLASGKLPVDLLIDATDIGLGDLNEALADLARGRIQGKVMVVPSLDTSTRSN